MWAMHRLLRGLELGMKNPMGDEAVVTLVGALASRRLLSQALRS